MHLVKKVHLGQKNHEKTGEDILWTKHKGKISLGKYVEEFVFSESIYHHKSALFNALLNHDIKKYLSFDDKNEGNKEQFDEILKGVDGFIYDMASSVLKKLYYQGFIEKVVDERALKLCRDIIINEGYEEITSEMLDGMLREENAYAEKVPGEIQNILIVAGSQNDLILETRLQKVIRIIPKFRDNLSIVTTGANPIENKASSASILNESIRMFNRLEELIELTEPRKPYTFEMRCETESATSKQNIEFALQNFVNRSDKVYNIIIVSSTFHLIQLSEELELYLSARFKEDSSKPESERLKIQNILLFGAENVDFKFIPLKHAAYLKLMFFAIYKKLFSIMLNQKKEN
jgi:hypothetical protein